MCVGRFSIFSFIYLCFNLQSASENFTCVKHKQNKVLSYLYWGKSDLKALMVKLEIHKCHYTVFRDHTFTFIFDKFNKTAIILAATYGWFLATWLTVSLLALINSPKLSFVIEIWITFISVDQQPFFPFVHKLNTSGYIKKKILLNWPKNKIKDGYNLWEEIIFQNWIMKFKIGYIQSSWCSKLYFRYSISGFWSHLQHAKD